MQISRRPHLFRPTLVSIALATALHIGSAWAVEPFVLKVALQWFIVYSTLVRGIDDIDAVFPILARAMFALGRNDDADALLREALKEAERRRANATAGSPSSSSRR